MAALLASNDGHGSRMHSTAPIAVLRVDGLPARVALRAEVDALALRADLKLSGDRLLATIAAHIRHPHIVRRSISGCRSHHGQRPGEG
eukprot:7111736-Alexandrium_andersonii.AAC.1